MLEVLALVLLAAAACGVLYLAHLAARQRSNALAALAAALGAQFEPDMDRDLPGRFPQFALFCRGDNRVAYNTLRGQLDAGSWSAGYTMGDYRYTVQAGRHRVTHRTSYLLVHLPFAQVPDLYIRREGMLDRIAGAIGFDDIDFESEEFSRRFHVKGDDKRFAYDIIHPRMMEFLLAAEPPALELVDGDLLIAHGTARWAPDEFRLRLAWAREFLVRWPAHLVERLRA